MTHRVAVATCADVPDLDGDGASVVAALAEAGLRAEPAVWDDPAVDWRGFDAVVVRSTWDYAERREAFLGWAASVARVAHLLNRLDVLEWNTDKRYLRDLAAAGLPVVPTTFLAPGEAVWLPADGEYVVKPSVSAGSRDTARYGGEDRRRAEAHARRLLATGRTVMVQPYLDAVDRNGETALVYLDGAFSHGLCKGPLLERGAEPVEGLFAPEEIAGRPPSAAERALADDVIAAVERRFGTLAYARVDLVPGAGGSPVLLELELTEPSLFLAEGGATATPLAAAVERLLVDRPEGGRAGALERVR